MFKCVVLDVSLPFPPSELMSCGFLGFMLRFTGVVLPFASSLPPASLFTNDRKGSFVGLLFFFFFSDSHEQSLFFFFCNRASFQRSSFDTLVPWFFPQFTLRLDPKLLIMFFFAPVRGPGGVLFSRACTD